MNHLSDEQLILHYYGESEEPAAVAGHLASCQACRDADAALRRTLAAVTAPEVPERGDSYGTQVWLRIAPRLDKKKKMPWMVWRWAAAAAVLMIASFLAGRYSPRSEPPGVQAKDDRGRILFVAVSDHLERSRMVLAELANAPAGGLTDITREQDRAEDLLSGNRLYRQTAAQVGENGIASLLEELELVLVEIARAPAEATPDRVERIRERIEAQGILFKIHVVESQVRQREALPAPVEKDL